MTPRPFPTRRPFLRGLPVALVLSAMIAACLGPVAALGQTAPPAAAKPAAAAPASQDKAAPAPAEAKPAPPKPDISEPLKEVRAKLDAAKGDLAQREKDLGRPDLTGADLTRIRDGVTPVADEIRGIIERLNSPLESARERLTQLGPKPKEGEESAEIAKERVEREAAVTQIDETQKLARSLLVQSDQIVDRVSNRRRAAFTKGLFEQSQALAAPGLWSRVAEDLPRDLRALQSAVSDIALLFSRNGTIWNLLLLGLAFGVFSALYFGRRNIAPRYGHRDDSVAEPDRRSVLLAAWRVLLLGTVPAVIGSYAIYYALDATDLLPSRLLPVAAAVTGGFAFVAVVEALCDALVAPDHPKWRPAPVTDAAAGRLTTLAVSIATVIAVVKAIEALNSGISAALPVSIATRGIGAVVTGLILAIGLHRFADSAEHEEEENCFGPYVAPQASSALGGPARLVGWAAVIAVCGAPLIGFVAFAAFLVDQLVWSASVLVLLYLLAQSVDTFVGGALKENTRFATTLQANTGLRKRSLTQIAVLSTGALRVLLIATAALLVLAPWGLDSTDIFSSIRTAFFGFKVGDVTVSPSTIVFGIGILILGIFITRAVQRWLENTYLPATELDAGLRNSISTISGYCGFLLALAMAFSYLGLSLEKLTIVAGALSVGIGFGLQSIVNNFVSGLLLLWERPIRVGDQVLIGDSEGIVKRISVRSTEIQTFDRSAVIVPNSNLISGVVKNRVRGDRAGRVSITVSVLRNQDPVRAAELIEGCARAHPDVMKEPAPRVVFRKIGDPYLEFELLATIVDVGLGLKVQTDLNFAVFRTLSQAGLIPPMGTPTSIVTVQGLDSMQNAIGEMAGVFGRQGREQTGTEVPADRDEDAAEAEPMRSAAPREIGRRSAGAKNV
ncbi:DUF3772 domain-containing protein [Methylobacterium sp. sgz302541]|uniref:DUF3772 domain-containing protein n=1 Tax=unclassified Methylobacterium TaxID=2615210 RepID=UPI003D338E2F